MNWSKTMKKTNKGFTLIELIMVMIILGIMAAVAIPRYLETISKSEVSSEDAIVNRLTVALENYAQQKMLTEGRRYWPDNPFDALTTSPQSYSNDGTNCDEDNEWTFVLETGTTTDGNPFSGKITHQRADNSRFQWSYYNGINTGTDDDVTGALYARSDLGTTGSVVLFR